MALEPAAHAHPAQALGDELQLAVAAAGVVYAHQGAVLGQAGGVEVARVGHRLVDVEQRQALVLGIGHQLQGLGPVLVIDDDRQHLRREERAVVDGDDVQLVRQVLAGQGERGGRLFGLEVFGTVAHGGPCLLDR